MTRLPLDQTLDLLRTVRVDFVEQALDPLFDIVSDRTDLIETLAIRIPQRPVTNVDILSIEFEGRTTHRCDDVTRFELIGRDFPWDSIREINIVILHDSHDFVVDAVGGVSTTSNDLNTVFEATTVTLAFGERCRHLTTTSILYTNEC